MVNIESCRLVLNEQGVEVEVKKVDSPVDLIVGGKII